MRGIVKHIEGCRAYGITYGEWRRQRHFVAAEIDKPGSFLDLGCANGFLIRCLEKWSGHRFVPYGIDIDPAAIAACRRMFPCRTSYFACTDVRAFVEERPIGFPDRYDYVFWNIPNSWSPEDKSRQLLRLIPLVAHGGKMLVAVYGTNAPDMSVSEREAERHAVVGVFLHLQVQGIGFRRIRYNPWGTNHGVGVVATAEGTTRDRGASLHGLKEVGSEGAQSRG